MTGIPFMIADKDFKSSEGNPCLKCSVRTHQGWLYLFRRSFLYITKPVLYIKFEELTKI